MGCGASERRRHLRIGVTNAKGRRIYEALTEYSEQCSFERKSQESRGPRTAIYGLAEQGLSLDYWATIHCQIFENLSMSLRLWLF